MDRRQWFARTVGALGAAALSPWRGAPPALPVPPIFATPDVEWRLVNGVVIYFADGIDLAWMNLPDGTVLGEDEEPPPFSITIA